MAVGRLACFWAFFVGRFYVWLITKVGGHAKLPCIPNNIREITSGRDVCIMPIEWTIISAQPESTTGRAFLSPPAI